MKMTTQEYGAPDPNIPQWKRDLIMRRRAVGRVLPTGSGSVQLTCPTVVAAVRLAEYSVKSNFHRDYEIEREETGVFNNNKRLAEQVKTSDDFVEPCVILGIKEIITKIESVSNEDVKMGEEKNGKKKYNSPLNCEKKSNELSDDECASVSSEEFKYGPGIVSKLKSKYLSLTLQNSQSKIRPSLDNFRRATSLENILNNSEPKKSGDYESIYLKNVHPLTNGSLKQRCRGLCRNNKESIKRARSVEVLTKFDKGNFVHNKSIVSYLKKDESENEKNNIRIRLSSLNVEEKELPPPDVVKHTLKIFEKSQNSKNFYSEKKKNQKNASDSVCAKKPLICPKPFIPKHNGAEKIDQKNSQNQKNLEMIDSNINDFSEDKITSKSVVRNLENISENGSTGSSASDNLLPDLSGTVSRRKAALLKENSCESVINKFPVNETQAKFPAQDYNNGEKNSTPIPVLKKGLSLDLTDLPLNHTNIPKTSPKFNSDRLITDSPESKRCISPVLIRAPPSVLSAELNSASSPAQHMKQVGVIRPIVTNKLVQSNLTNQQLNKCNLTEREIEKNLINTVKCIEQQPIARVKCYEPVSKVIVSLKKSPDECFGNETKLSNETPKRGQFWDKKPNTMVFNFSNRKTIPDYIENDGLILAPKKEKAKMSEPGIIFLSGGTEESSTDFDFEELTTEPHLPCDIVFEGGNVLINGRSNIQSKPKSTKMKIQFNDEATTLFEYPSESSLLEDQENFKPEIEVPSSSAIAATGTNGTSLLGLPLPFSCGNLASYTPSKVSLSADFQLGITKTVPPPKSGRREKTKEEDGGTREDEDGAEGEDGEDDDDDGKDKDEDEDAEEEEEENYLRPADENATIHWSSETASDLLF